LRRNASTLDPGNSVDAKSLFQEWSHAEAGLTALYGLTHTRCPTHGKVFTMEMRLGEEVCGTGAGRSKQHAAQETAQAALRGAGLA
jgi:ribonuclease-3